MIEIADKIEGNIELSENTRLRGMIVGSVTVPTSIRLEMYGTVTRDLIAENHSEVIVHGTVGGGR